MYIKSIKLTNFKNFEKAEYSFNKITLLQGQNGTGKTTLALESILFAIYGFTTKELLSDLPTRSKSKSCTVEVKFEANNVVYTVIRSFPTKLIVKKDDKIIKFSTNSEGNKYICDLLGSRENFQKFIVIDSAKESNLLEQGNVALKRIIFAGSDEIFNNMRVKLLEIKRKRELLNKDRVKTSSHYPSEKRLQLISCKLDEINLQKSKLDSTIRSIESDAYSITRTVGKLEGEKEILKRKRDKLLTNKKCYACLPCNKG